MNLIKKYNLDVVYVYHYSTSSFEVLKTLDAQAITKKDKEKAGEINKKYTRNKNYPYTGSISLFMEPIPLDKIHTYFDKHPFWHKGKKLYEHRININSIGDSRFRLVESSTGEFFSDHVPDWVFDNFFTVYKFFKLTAMDILDTGKGISELLKVIEKHKGVTASKFAERKYPKSELYAQGVPHLMVYPENGTLEVYDAVRKTIGE